MHTRRTCFSACKPDGSAQEELNNVRERLSSARLLREVRVRQEGLAELTDRLARGHPAYGQGTPEFQSRVALKENPLLFMRRELPGQRAFLMRLRNGSHVPLW